MTSEQLITFRIAGDLWGIDILLVREIIHGMNITAVPRSFDYIRGLTNLRGQLVTIIDLAARVGRSQDGSAPGSTCIILKKDCELEQVRLRDDSVIKTGANTIGLLVDSIGDVIRADRNKCSPGPIDRGSGNAEFISGILQLDEDVVLVLSLEHVLEHSHEKATILR